MMSHRQGPEWGASASCPMDPGVKGTGLISVLPSGARMLEDPSLLKLCIPLPYAGTTQ